MTSPIDPIRRSARPRRSGKAAERAEAAAEAERSGLPVPAGPVRTVPPVADIPGSAAEFDAHLIGQDGQRRGLRAGPGVIDAAAATYNRIEWSGSKDRRARKGRIAKTKV